MDVSSFIRKSRDTKGFIFWLDDCSAQNKNWYLYTALLNEVDSEEGYASLVTLKYFEPGHTFTFTFIFTFSTFQKEFLKPIALVKSVNLNKYRQSSLEEEL